MLGLIHILCFVPLVHGLSKFNPIVITKQGFIMGLWSENGQYTMFLGIPYAVVNKSNPFGPSVRRGAFDSIFKAFDDTKICPQIAKNIAIGTIDCLRLSIYVPSRTTYSPLPVMVWFHTGAFVRGSGSREEFSPDFLTRHNVIIVTVNYRLGPYGFLCLNTPTVSGNQGLKDQVLALKWVNENIQSFGGDANKVTIFGASSGARSIHLHLLSNNEKLFDRAIIQSGVVMAPWHLVRPDSTVPLRIAKELGFETNVVEYALTFLANQDVHLVIRASYELGLSKDTGIVQPQTSPCLEDTFEGAFITDYPFNKRSTKVRNMPIIIGYDSQEMLYKFGNADSEVFNAYSFQDRLISGLDLIDDEIASFVKHYYVGDENIDISLKHQILNFESDFNYNHPTERTIERYMNDGADSIYYYVFSYEGERNYLKKTYNINTTGACHADDLGYLFKSDFLSDEPTPKDQRMIDTMTTMWTNFAKYGDPTPDTNDLLPVKWLPVNNSTKYYLKIDYKLSLLTRPFRERMAFWDLFYKLNGESQNGMKNKHTNL